MDPGIYGSYAWPAGYDGAFRRCLQQRVLESLDGCGQKLFVEDRETSWLLGHKR